MSYKNKKELKEAQKKWNSNRLRDISPAGYQRHLSAVEAFNSRNKNSSSSTPVSSKKKGDGDGKGKKWSASKSEREAQDANIALTNKAAMAAKNYKPTKLNLQQKDYEVTLPKRPNVPKLPKLNVPGGGLTIKEVANPSGLPGTINKYSPKSDYSKSYPNALPKQNTTKNPFGRNTSTYAPGVSAPGAKGKTRSTNPFSKQNTTSKAPGVTGGVRPIPKEPFGKGTSNYAPGASTGPAPKKKNSSPFSSKK